MRAGAHCLALVTDAFGGHGGIAQYNRDFLGALAEGSAPSSITVLPRHAPERTAAPAAINQLPARRGRLSYAATALLMAFRRRVDVVFCGHLYLTPLAWLIARLKGAKLVLQMHGIEAWPRPSRLQRAATETADLVLCVSRYTRACVIGWAAMASERVVVVPDMVGDGFTPGDGRELRAALGIEAKRVLLTVGRMDSRERYKGHDRVIAAIPDLVTWGHDVVYLIIGKGDDRARLEQLARENGGAERIRFLGAIDKERLVDAYRMADLFVMPSTGEGFGIAFLEAMASGTPALGFAVAGARDALADGELGTTVLEDDLSDAIARLLAMPKPNPDGLSQTVRARFGRRIFQVQVCTAFDRLLQPASSEQSLAYSAAKRASASALGCIPLALRRGLLRRAALAPPLFKTRNFERLFARICASGVDRTQLIETNFGLASHICCRVPLHKTGYAFGRPQNNAFERGAIALVNELSKDCLHFLDVGAHEGIFTLSVFHAMGKDIILHWFEPDSVLFLRLCENLRRNSIEAHANRVAAADHNGCSTFFRNLTSDLSGSLGTHFQKWHSTQPEPVETIRLSDYIVEKQISRAMVKVDVEGTGTQVWSGLAERSREISYLVIEMLTPEIEGKLPARIIQQTGWHAYYIRDFELIESRNGEFVYVEPFWNWLFCGLDPTALQHRISGSGLRVTSAV